MSMGNILYSAKNNGAARILRKNMTPEELHLWYDCLSKLPVAVRRQKPIGDYVVDFYCAKARLVIELDGSQHNSPEGRASDKERDEYLGGLGIRVMRFKNIHVMREFNSVCRSIVRCIEERAGINIGLYK